MRPVVVLALGFLLAWPAWASDSWVVEREESWLGFVASQSGAPVEGRFTDWRAEILFDPAAPEKAYLRVEVMAAAVETGSGDQEQTIRGPNLLDAERFPLARYEAHGFTGLGGNRFRAEGALTIRDVTRPLDLPFILEIAGEEARASGEVLMDRLEYEVGQGDWRDTSLVAAEVLVRFEIHARRAPD